MTADEIAAWLTGEFRFPHPDWTIDAKVGPLGVVVVTVTLTAPDSAGVAGLRRLERWRVIAPGSIDDVSDLRRWVTTYILSVVVHEALEWVRESDDTPTYHPHTAAGQEAWANDGPRILAGVRP